MTTISVLQKARYDYHPKLPAILAEHGPLLEAIPGAATQSLADAEAIRGQFPHTYGLPVVRLAPAAGASPQPLNVGVVLSGGQAPGGHNVIAGVYDALQRLHPDSQLYGFLSGPKGLIRNNYQVLDAAVIDAHRNTGGFDLVGSGRDKLESREQFEKVAENCRALHIHAVIIIGGDDSNTNACALAEYFLQNKVATQVIGVPKTIDGDLKNEMIEVSFGFDTATKVYSDLIGNIERDALSAKKYWHFIKLMGRSASHVTLECALQTQPDIALISEEVAEKGMTLREIVDSIAGVVRDRSAAGLDFGVVLIPEGLIEFIPEMKQLISELNDLLAHHQHHFATLKTADDRRQFVGLHLTAGSSQAFSSLPAVIQEQLLMDRDSHGQVQVSRIETERLLIDLVGDRLAAWKSDQTYSGRFQPLEHFFGYEGRCELPSNFDADYCYGLGYTAVGLVAAGKTGYMAALRNLASPAAQWIAGGAPLTMMMNMERRKGKDVPVIRKSLVDLQRRPFQEFAARRDQWARETAYVHPGPIQYFGPAEQADRITRTLQLEAEENGRAR